VLNGAGEMTGSLQVAEWGVIQTPVYLTATMAVGRVYDGAVAVAVAADPAVGVEDVVIPVVAECDDSWLSDPHAAHAEAADVGRAVAEADAVFAQGAVGAAPGWSASISRPGSVALSTARGDDTLLDGHLDPLFEATVDATEEAVVNALWHAETTVGREGRVAHALPHDAVLELLDGHRRLGVR
jgi:L-aminopeptidase/D-esterase-like protein